MTDEAADTSTSNSMSARSGLTINAAFVLGVLGALLVVAGSLLPQLSVPGHLTGSLFDPSILLADPPCGKP